MLVDPRDNADNDYNAARNLAASWTGGGSTRRSRVDQHRVPDQFDPFCLEPAGQECTSIHPKYDQQLLENFAEMYRCQGSATPKMRRIQFCKPMDTSVLDGNQQRNAQPLNLVAYVSAG